MNRQIFSNVKILALIAIGVIAFSGSALMLQDKTQVEIIEDDGVLRAAIIDQLWLEIPSEAFLKQATEYLETAGYEVDIFKTGDITVDFYKNLPSMNYEYIVVRTHGASAQNNELVTLFTGEPYQDDKYISEQLFGTIKVGSPIQEVIYSMHDDEGKETEWVRVNETTRIWSGYVYFEKDAKDEYFVITPKLVKDLMVGTFPDSVIILGGCNTAEYDSMARALLERGAKDVVGWDESVSNAVNDQVILELLKENLINNSEIGDAVDLLKEKLNGTWSNRYYDGALKHYSSANL